MNTELYIKCWTQTGEMQFSMFLTQFCSATEVWGVGMVSGYGKIPNASALNQSFMLDRKW